MELYNDLLVTELSYEIEFYCYQLKENEDIVSRDVIKKNITNLLEKYCVYKKSEIKIDSLDDSIKLFLLSKKINGLSSKTLYNYELQLNRFSKMINKPVNLIDINDIRGFINSISNSNNIKQNSINFVVSVLKSFFNFLVDENIIKNNPIRKLKILKKDDRLRKPLIKKELTSIDKSCNSNRDKAIISLMLSTGCRISEIESIKISDIDFKNRTIIVTGKGDKERKVYFIEECKEKLMVYINEIKNIKRDKDDLFISKIKPYKKLSSSGIRKILKNIVKNTNIKRSIYPHLLRHTFATNAINSGMDIVSLQVILGHANVNTTEIYAKMNDRFIRKKYNKLKIAV